MHLPRMKMKMIRGKEMASSTIRSQRTQNHQKYSKCYSLSLKRKKRKKAVFLTITAVLRTTMITWAATKNLSPPFWTKRKTRSTTQTMIMTISCLK